jgi:hypothetical protein
MAMCHPDPRLRSSVSAVVERRTAGLPWEEGERIEVQSIVSMDRDAVASRDRQLAVPENTVTLNG